MQEEQGKQVKFVLNTENMPIPVFANHIQVMSTTETATITFYAGLLDRAYESADELPDEVAARPVAQIVVPQSMWEQLLGILFAKRLEEEGGE
jgi:hypothetical protein